MLPSTMTSATTMTTKKTGVLVLLISTISVYTAFKAIPSSSRRSTITDIDFGSGIGHNRNNSIHNVDNSVNTKLMTGAIGVETDDVGGSGVVTMDDLLSSVTWPEWCRKTQFPGWQFAPFADKHGVKEFITRVAPGLPIPVEYGYVDNVTEIDNDFLQRTIPPNTTKFMLKATHLSGGISMADMSKGTLKVLKFPGFQGQSGNLLNSVRINCDKYLNTSYAIVQEKQYQLIKRRCIFEEKLDVGSNDLQDYKVFMIHGRPYMVIVFSDRFTGNKTISLRTP
jgi:TupA-like ATPgrasp